jgi:hypothetical protein
LFIGLSIQQTGSVFLSLYRRVPASLPALLAQAEHTKQRGTKNAAV